VQTLRAPLAEFLGTLLITTTVIGSGIMAQQLTQDVLLQLMANMFATVMVLALLIWLLAPISGAYFNPAVALIALMRKGISVGQFLVFTFVQCLGAVLGAILANGLFSRTLIEQSTKVRSGGALFVSEILATAGLVLIIFLAANQGRGESAFWLVPMWIGGAYVFTSSTSFANPAITLGRGLSDSFAGIAPASIPLFLIAQVIGALLGHFLANALADSRKN
jgi:glycerol uptake facilitator-like aquaporin